MSQAAERARLFVALELPGAVAEELAGWAQRAVGAGAGWRVLHADMLHVTLCFLGWRELPDAPRIAALALEQAAPLGPLRVTAPAWLPPRRPRVLAVDLEDGGEAVALQARVSEALAGGAGYEPERRPFRPHVTVARAGRRGAHEIAPLPDPPALEFGAAALTLYRSHLARSGASYEPLARAGV